MAGCGLSHRAVWQDVIQKKYRYALVFEDDAVLCAEFQLRLDEALHAAPADFDVLLLGCFFMCDASRKQGGWKGMLRPFLWDRRDDTRTWKNGTTTVFVPEKFSGTHAYVVSLQGAKKLLQQLPRVGFHVDFEMGHPNIAVYAVEPHLARQLDMSTSTIASYDFPKLLVPYVSGIRDDQGIPLAYYLDVPVGQVFGFVGNAWAAVFLLLGIVLPPRWWLGVFAYFVVEVVFGALPRGMMIPVMTYLIGLTIRSRIFPR